MNIINEINKQVDTIVTLTKLNAPTLLTITGVGGFVTTVVMAVKATPEALERKKVLDEKLSDNSSKKDILVESAKAYVPVYASTALMGTLSIACVLEANHISSKRLAAVTTAYSLSETAFKEYREKVVETIGEKKEQAVRDEIAKDHVDNTPVTDDVMEATLGAGLFMDSVSKRYFRSTREDILQALRRFERWLYSSDFLTLNEWYDFLDEASTTDLEHIPIGDNVGFNSTMGIDIYFSVQKAPNGEACTVIEYRTPPTYDMYV